MIIYKTHVLSYPVGRLALDVCLLFLMAGLEVLRVYWGLRGNLQESEGYTGLNLIGTGATVLLALYFVIWQSYVLRADVIIGAILICFYGLTGIVGFGTLAGFRRAAVTVNGLLNEPHFNNSNSETGLQKMSRVSFTRKTRETKETDDVSNIRLLKVRQRNLTFLKVCSQKRLKTSHEILPKLNLSCYPVSCTLLLCVNN
ncbi:hypothetical protein PO909_021939 [Leuciscus waleckii]